MKKLVVVFVVFLSAFSVSFAGENPKVLKEIKRKLTLDLSSVELCKAKKDFVIVKFRITNNEIDIIECSGTRDELTALMEEELKQMFIHEDADPNEVFRYKFTFEKE